MNRAHACRCAAWLHDDALSAVQSAAAEGAGHDRADTAHGESAIDREPRLSDIARRREQFRFVRDRGFQLTEATRVHRGCRKDRGVGKWCSNETLADRRSRGLERGSKIAFRERDDHAPHAEILEDLQVLLGLRHPAVVRRHDQEGEVNRAHAGDHVLDEILVAGDVDDAERNVIEDELREAELDRDSALLFFRQPIRLCAGERTDERGLAVIDMAGSGESEMLHNASAAWSAWTSASSSDGKMVRRSSLRRSRST